MTLTADSLQSRLQAGYPALAGTPHDLMARLCDVGRNLRLPAGTVVFDEQQPCQGFPLLLGGKVRVLKQASNGREITLYTVRPGETCLMSSGCLLGHCDYSARGVADSDLELQILTPDLFDELVARQPPFRQFVFGVFADRMGSLMQLVEEVAFQRMDRRLAALLLARADEQGCVCLSHQQLADELGSVREIVSRLMRSFAAQGWLNTGRERITLTDPKALAAFADAV